MAEAETQKQASSWTGMIKLAIMVLVLVCAAVYIPMKLLAVKFTDRGTELRNKRKYQEAIAEYEKALRFHPWFKPARQHLVEVYVEMGDEAATKGEHAEAVVLYERAQGLPGEANDLYYKLAQARWRLDRIPQALADVEKHLEQKPDHGPALRLRALLQRIEDEEGPTEE